MCCARGVCGGVWWRVGGGGGGGTRREREREREREGCVPQDVGLLFLSSRL
jgi:hypothetical protein